MLVTVEHDEGRRPVRHRFVRLHGIRDHPTVKPTAMPQDALIDLTNRGDIVIDPLLGSGSTLIAAETTGRVCRGVELDPLYIGVIVRRYQAATDEPMVLPDTGEAFEGRAHSWGRRRPSTAPSASIEILVIVK